MTQPEALNHTTFGNLVIANFMNLSTQLHMTEHPVTGEYIDSCQLMFNTSWDWLMPVYRKISEMPGPELPKGANQQTPEMDEWSNRIGDITGAIIDVDLDDAWDEIITFLEWDNKQHK